MSLLSPERVLVGLAPAAVTVRRQRGLLRKVLDEKTLECDPAFGPQPRYDNTIATNQNDRSIGAPSR